MNDYVYKSHTNFIKFNETTYKFDKKYQLATQWSKYFDKNNKPLSQSIANSFLNKFYQLFTNFPRLDHDIICREVIFKKESYLDFPVNHPVALDYYAFYFTVEGSAQLDFGKDCITVTRGDFVIIPPSAECHIQRHQHSEHWDVYSGHFRLRSQWLDLVDWLKDFNRPYILDFTEHEETTTELLRQLIDAKIEITPIADRLSENLMEQVLIRLKCAIPTDRSFGDARIIDTVNHLLQHIGENISVTQLAERQKLSVSHFSHLFHSAMGLSIVNWREKVRIEKASKLLQYTTLPVAEIADRVGFHDPLYFSRRFKRQTDLAPIKYRQSTSAI